MKKESYLFILILPLMWVSYCLFELFTRNFYISNFFILLIIPSLVLFFISYLFIQLSMHLKNGFPNKILLTLFLFLFFLDQGLKLIIKLLFFEKNFYIIPNLLSFTPIINTKGSWLNVRFNTNINFITLILINIIALFLFTEVYRYFNTKNNKNFFTDLCYTFIIAGSLCSLIDKVFYGGSLDFIGIGNLFIADFKDIYINLAIFMFIIAIYNFDYIDNNKASIQNHHIKLKEFLIFIVDDIKLNILKIK